MVTIIVAVIIIGLVWFFVDRFLLVPYTPAIVRMAVAILMTIFIIILLTNGLGLTHFHLPSN